MLNDDMTASIFLVKMGSFKMGHNKLQLTETDQEKNFLRCLVNALIPKNKL